METLVDRSLSHIRKYLFKDAKFIDQSKNKVLRGDRFNPVIISHETERILNLEKEIIVNNFPWTRIGIDDIRGFYLSEEGKIYLPNGNWCIKTIIHETLHSCSIIRAIPNQLYRYKELIEGLTEFYTGYILYKEYKDPFTNCWKAEYGRRCTMTYQPTTRLWSTFCQFIPIQETFNIFFPASVEKSWNKIFEAFLENINEKFNLEFHTRLDLDSASYYYHETFRNECSHQFNNFDRIYNSNLCTDFTRIKTNNSFKS